MQEIIELLSAYVRAVWLRRWYIVGVAWIVCVVGWAFVIQMPDVYKASARVHIDTQSFLRPLLRGLTFNTSRRQQIQLMVQTLLSRPNLEKIARLTDLDLTAKNDVEMEALLDELKTNIQLARASRNNDLYQVSYTHHERELAKKVVEAVLTVFVESALGENREETVTAKRFLESEIKDYESRLKESEQRLVDFKRKNLDLLSSGSDDYYSRLRSAMGAREQAVLQLKEAERERDSIQEQLNDQESELDFLFEDNPQISIAGSSSFDGRINNLQARLDDLLIKYTDQHPDILTLKAQIEELQGKRDKELSATQKVEMETENPVLQSLKLSLSAADSKVASLKVRVSNYDSNVKKLQELVHTLPAVDAELAALNRDYGVVKSKYNQLLERREQANISQKANQSSDEIEFKIIDPARVPFEPSGPDRVLFMSFVLIGGIAAGFGVALLMSLIKPAYHTTKMLSMDTGLPVLGNVSMFKTTGQVSVERRWLFVYIAAGFSLLVVYAGLFLWQMLAYTSV